MPDVNEAVTQADREEMGRYLERQITEARRQQEELEVIGLDGYCPMGCGQTLKAEETRAVNRVICWSTGCPDPLAAQKILNDPETEHVVRFDGSGFTIRHPLRERLGDELMGCDLHLVCMALPGPPDGRPGMFHGLQENGRWVLKREGAPSLHEEPAPDPGCVPGDRSEELPPHLLSVIDVPAYVSTACLTADACLAAIPGHPDLAGKLNKAAAALWARCRTTQKFTGQNCAGHTHGGSRT